MDKKFFPSDKAVSVEYLPPRIVRARQGWYLVFYQVDKESGALVRHRKSYNLGRLPSQGERLARAKELCRHIEGLMKFGYPYCRGGVVYELHRFTNMLRQEEAAHLHLVEEDARTVAEAVAFVTELKCKSESKDTIRTYSSRSKLLMKFLKEKGWDSLPVRAFTVKHAQAYLDDARRRVDNNTYNNYRRECIIFWNAMMSRDIVASNPFKATEKLSKKKKRRRDFTLEEAVAVLQHLYENEWWLFVMVILHAGECFRRTEAYRMRFRDFHVQEGFIQIDEAQSKDKTEEVITIPDQVRPFFLDERFRSAPPHYLIFGQGGKPHPSKTAGESTYRNRHRDILLKLQKEGKLTDIEGLSLYSWKDTGMTALAKFLTPFELRDHARHSDTKMSMRYYHAQKIIPSVQAAELPFLKGIVGLKKETEGK